MITHIYAHIHTKMYNHLKRHNRLRMLGAEFSPFGIVILSASLRRRFSWNSKFQDNPSNLFPHQQSSREPPVFLSNILWRHLTENVNVWFSFHVSAILCNTLMIIKKKSQLIFFLPSQ